MSPETSGHRFGYHQALTSHLTAASMNIQPVLHLQGPSASSGTIANKRLQSVMYLDMCGVAYFISYTILIFVTSVVVIMPVIYEESPQTLTLRRWFAVYLVFNTVANYILTVRNRSYYKITLDRDQGLPDSNWKHCIDCQHSSPPRTHHCTLCDHCILKRDHHCFFTAACIGFYNQRWFLGLCFYSTVSTMYGFYLTWQYITMEYMSPMSSNFYHFLLPVTVFECLIGYNSWTFLYMTVLMYTNLVTMIGCGAMFTWQFYIACIGISSYELSKNIRTYRSYNILDNLNLVFGPFWILQFIIPLPFLKNKGDGIHWSQTSKLI